MLAMLIRSKESEIDKRVIGRVEEIAKKRGVSMTTIATAWCLSKDKVNPIIGLSSKERIDQAVESVHFAKSGKLTKEDIEYLEEGLGPCSVPRLGNFHHFESDKLQPQQQIYSFQIQYNTDDANYYTIGTTNMSDTVDTVKAEQNQRLMQLLGAELESNPDADLSTIFGRFQLENRPKSKKPPPKKMDYCEMLVAYAKDAEIIYPLSDSAERLLSGTRDYTEYTALQYLALHMPDVPAPKPLGLVTFSGCRIMFMTYFPSMTLEQAWPKLNHENKLSIQQQLETIFSRLRSMKKPAGLPLGGVNGEGVKDWHMDRREGLRKDSIKTVEAFEDMLFTVDEWPPTKAWTKFLRSFLPAPKTTVCVFTHGDFRAAQRDGRPG
ncbi:Versiconal hemiacetal acetate reductase [Lachnellula willkommii]|uniref:Versiconal hemiacetal acetate reductase n=1 Tax=Lachnellula willkommii TaxID=215461 RepID=A0A559M7V7_9HELO|nr:Versiconal hemiacetal acetate reductase [Lachnellula willkommii]